MSSADGINLKRSLAQVCGFLREPRISALSKAKRARQTLREDAQGVLAAEALVAAPAIEDDVAGSGVSRL